MAQAIRVAGLNGTGKTRLLLFAAVAAANTGKKVLFISTESYGERLLSHAEHLGIPEAALRRDNLKFLGVEPALYAVLNAIPEGPERPDVIIVDEMGTIADLPHGHRVVEKIEEAAGDAILWVSLTLRHRIGEAPG